MWRVREKLLLLQNLCDSTQGFRIFPLIFLECSQYLFTRKLYLSYCTRLLLDTRFVLKVKSFPLSWRPKMKISSILYIYSLKLRCSITLFLSTKSRLFFGIHKKRRFLNIFYVFLFKSLITEKCKLISMNINGYKLLKNVLHFNKRWLLCFKNILRPLSVHVIWILW